MADWNFRAFHSRYERFLVDFGQKLQGLQEVQQSGDKCDILHRRVDVGVLQDLFTVLLLRIFKSNFSICVCNRTVEIFNSRHLNAINSWDVHGLHVVGAGSTAGILDLLHYSGLY